MDEATQQLYARLTAYEFLIEVLFARLWSGASSADAEADAESIKRLMRQAYLASDADQYDLDDALPILRESQVVAERLVEKATSRATQIREQLAQAHDSQ